MKRVLHISASPVGAASHSRRFGQQLVSGLQRRHGAHVTRRDLAAEPPPYPDDAFVRASLMPKHEHGTTEIETLSLSETLIGELEHADAVVIDSPMHNLMIPACLKGWIDCVVRPNRTFRNSPVGKVGLLSDKPVYVLVACGGGFDTDAGGQTDFLSPYLRHILASIGLASVDIFRLEHMLRSETAVADSHARAEAWIDGRLAQELRRCETDATLASQERSLA